MLNATQYGISGSDENGGLVFKLGEAGNEIAGWEISGSRIHKYNGVDGGLIMDAENLRYDVYTGSVSTNNIVRMGQLDDSDNFGILGNDTEGSLLFKLGMLGNEIAGWEISGSQIHKYNGSTGGLRMRADNLSYDVYTGSNQDNTVVQMGQIATNLYGIRGNDQVGGLLFKLGQDGNEIAGWEISGSRIHKYNDHATPGKQGGLIMDAANLRYDVYTGSNSANTIVRMGELDGTPAFGIMGYNQTGGMLFKLGQLGNEIAGWTITDTDLGKGKITLHSETNASYFGIQDSYGYSLPGIWIGQTAALTYKASWSGSAGGML